MKATLALFIPLLTWTRAQVLNPPCPTVEGQCYYHTTLQGGVNHCTLGRVPNCKDVSVPGFAYEACDCNKTFHNGIDMILVFDQMPYATATGPNIPTGSRDIWEDYLSVLTVVLKRMLQQGDNTIGVIRPTTTGCDLFGYPNVLRLWTSVNNLELEYPFSTAANANPCSSGTCSSTTVKSGTCTKMARDLMAARPAKRKKIIFSLRHTPGDIASVVPSFTMQNEANINLFYFVFTTRPRSDYTVGSFNSEYDYGGFQKSGGNFVLPSDVTAIIGLTRNPAFFDATLGCGFVRCDHQTLTSLLQRTGQPVKQAAAIAPMMCTYFPNAPALTWVAQLNSGQNYIRRSVPAFTSWICQIVPPDPPTVAPTQSPTRRPTSCKGPPPDYVRPYCRSGATNCQNTNAIVQIQPDPTLTLNNDGTTTLCYSYTQNSGGSGTCAAQNNKPLRGISFLMDECCPDGRMDFVESAKAGIVSPVTKTRNECPVISWTSPQIGQIDCARVLRPCSAPQSVGQNCGILSMNDLDIAQRTSEFCVTVAGQTFDNGAGRLRASDQAKICFERGDDVNVALNVCTCLPVNFIPSTQICDKTGNPTQRPTTRPTASPTTVHPTASPQDDPTMTPTNRPTVRPTLSPTQPQPTTKKPSVSPTEKPPSTCQPHTPDIPITARTCGYNGRFCGEMDYTEWSVDVEYNMEDDYTMFTYCVDVDDSEEPMCNPSGGRGGSGRSGGRGRNRGNDDDSGNGGGQPARRSSRRSGGSTWGGRRRRMGWSWWNRPRFYGADGITLRLDDCCELCLSKDHIKAHWDRLQIANFDDEPSYLTLTRHYSERASQAERQCFHLKLKGDIPAAKGKYCVKGGPKCACGEIDVPSSCGMKDVADPSCASSSWKSGGSD